jgi:hypothetical protein
VSDNSVPLGGMTINPDGTVAYEFEGQVHAHGLDLDYEEAETISQENSIRWLDGSGAATATIASHDRKAGAVGPIPLGGPTLRLVGNSSDTDSSSAIQLATRLQAGADLAELDLVTPTGGFPSIWAKVRRGGPIPKDFFRLLLDSEEASSFVQLPARERIRLDFGSVLLPFIGGTLGTLEWPVTGEVDVPHRLDTEPLAVMAITEDRVWSVGVKEADDSKIRLWGATGYFDIEEGDYLTYWVAIG